MNDLPRTLHTWFTENRERLLAHGITGDIRRSPNGRDKSSSWLTLEAGDRIAMLIVWSTGEAELELGDATTGEVRPEHRDLRSIEELLEAVAVVRDWTLPAGTGTGSGTEGATAGAGVGVAE
ncbi:hypothetical protein HUT18_17015 [Streptomyces sp. NA04227]|uniref:immunity protein TriTu family protein n=1 Tax=Streptomyces sp. NA04227 TaxID=2742136 RepID=UPI00158FE5EC|nr:hypothetical protein [Streptomyces sp. NA04227]QKW07834.1 hypothetical protein HUT18_17015 [Streptomyces sp. NA04227]